MVTAFRITQTKYATTAFNGEGARLWGGRWNSKGSRVVYAAESLSLATLELLVHIEDYSTIQSRYCSIEVKIPEDNIETLATHDFPAGWDSDEVLPASQTIGDQWILENRSVALQVPSVVTKGEFNLLINPSHSDFGSLETGAPIPFLIDERLTG